MCIMRKVLASLTALSLAATAAQAAPRQTGEEKLAKALEGREAGKPVDCIYQRDIRSSRIYDRTAILYELNNGTYYLNRPDAGAQSLSWGDVLVTDTHSDRLCSIDVVKLYDTHPWMQNGFVNLGKFVPYKKVAVARSE
jgi:hypothetical protein